MKIVALLLLAFASFAAGAQDLVPGGTNTENEQEPLSKERIEQLITTLESDAERAELIDNLETLVAAQEEQEDRGPQVSRLFNLDETSNVALQAFARALNSLGLNDSTWGKVALLGIVTLGILIAVFINNWLSHFLDRKLNPLRSRLHFARTRFTVFFALHRWFGYVFALLLFVYALKEVFSLWPSVAEGDLGPAAVARYAFVFLIVCVVFAGVWETVNAFMEYGTHRSARLRNPRIQTLLPIVRNVLLFVLLLMAGLVVMSELGIEIMPLLAGAGVLGIAIGFGAQELVKDFLNGFIIILEDLLQVGDVVRVGDRVGLVEKITIRKIQLRSLDGTVYTVPFSEISVVDNLTKEFSYYLMDIGVAYRENVDEVIACIREILDTMREEDDYKDRILEPLEVLGVDKFADSAVIIKARIKTKPLQQWSVGREFNRRMKHAFDEREIEIPFPHQTIYFGQDKDGSAPKAQVKLFEAEDKTEHQARAANA